MTRLLSALAVAGAALAAMPAHAAPAQPLPVQVQVTNNDHTVGVGVWLLGQPGAGAFVSKDNPTHACVGLSYQIPFCTDRIAP